MQSLRTNRAVKSSRAKNFPHFGWESKRFPHCTSIISCRGIERPVRGVVALAGRSGFGKVAGKGIDAQVGNSERWIGARNHGASTTGTSIAESWPGPDRTVIVWER